jgi:hypothetical protein
MSDKMERPADDDIGERVREDVLVSLADAAAPTPVAAAAIDGERVRDTDADLFYGNGADVELFTENNDRESRLYPGRMLADRRVLQRLGWAVYYVTDKGVYAGGKRTNWLAMGKQVIAVAELRSIADRHRREAPERRAAS